MHKHPGQLYTLLHKEIGGEGYVLAWPHCRSWFLQSYVRDDGVRVDVCHQCRCASKITVQANGACARTVRESTHQDKQGTWKLLASFQQSHAGTQHFTSANHVLKTWAIRQKKVNRGDRSRCTVMFVSPWDDFLRRISSIYTVNWREREIPGDTVSCFLRA